VSLSALSDCLRAVLERSGAVALFDSTGIGSDRWPLTGRRDDLSAHGRQITGTPSASELLNTDGALLTRSHLRELGLERRAVDAVFRELECVFLPGYSRPLVRAADYLALVERSTYRGDRVRRSGGAAPVTMSDS
jgi:hypothetical protein